MSLARSVFVVSMMLAPGICAAQYTSVDYPNAQATRLRGINNRGDMVGYWTDEAGRLHGLLQRAGSEQAVTVDCEGAVSTMLNGLNSNREIVGAFRDGQNIWHPFYMGEPGGKCFAIDPPRSTGATSDTTASGISEDGEIAGQFVDDEGVTRGFLMRGPVYMVYDVAPGLSGAFGIAPNGDLLGHLQMKGDRMKGWWLSRSKLNIMEFPPAESNVMSCGFGGNSKGEVVGHYQRTGAAVRGFLYSQGEYIPLDYPDAASTDIKGINDSGVIVGIYTDKAQKVHGFVLRR